MHGSMWSIHLALADGPWTQSKAREEPGVGGCELQILVLGRIGTETYGIEDIDWRTSLLQDAWTRPLTSWCDDSQAFHLTS